MSDDRSTLPPVPLPTSDVPFGSHRVGVAASEGVDFVPGPIQQKTGKRWVDGRPIWQTTVLFHPSDPNMVLVGTNETIIAHLIADIASVVTIEGIFRSSAGDFFHGNYTQPGGNHLVLWASPTHVHMNHSSGMLSGLTGWVTVTFTRSTDPMP